VIGRLETILILQHAARAIQLAGSRLHLDGERFSTFTRPRVTFKKWEREIGFIKAW